MSSDTLTLSFGVELQMYLAPKEITGINPEAYRSGPNKTRTEEDEKCYHKKIHETLIDKLNVYGVLAKSTSDKYDRWIISDDPALENTRMGDYGK